MQVVRCEVELRAKRDEHKRVERSSKSVYGPVIHKGDQVWGDLMYSITSILIYYERTRHRYRKSTRQSLEMYT